MLDGHTVTAMYRSDIAPDEYIAALTAQNLCAIY
jgi:hypothetical protein